MLDTVQDHLYITTTEINMDDNLFANLRFLANLRYFIWVELDETGDVIRLSARDNMTLERIDMGDISEVPPFVRERLALIKLTGVNNYSDSRMRGALGRRLSEDKIIIYLDHNDYNYIKEECK